MNDRFSLANPNRKVVFSLPNNELPDGDAASDSTQPETTPEVVTNSEALTADPTEQSSGEEAK